MDKVSTVSDNLYLQPSAVKHVMEYAEIVVLVELKWL